jgi:hypothetical protein
MKKSVIVALSSLLSSSVVMASSEDLIKVTAEGMAVFEVGGRSQKNPYKGDKLISTNNKDIGANSAVNIGIKAEGNLENNIIQKYGAVAKVLTAVTSNLTSKSRVIDKTYIYAQGNFGRLEFGSNYSAGNLLRVSAGTITMTEGGATGNWSDYANDFIPQITDPTKAEFFITGENLYSDYHGKTLKRKEGKRKITYYTPVYNNFQFGISYIPDGANHGDGVREDTNPLVKVAKNIWNGGFKYDNKVDESWRVRFGVVADYAPGKLDTINGVSSPNRKNLFSYATGLIIEYKQVGFGFSYGNWGKSLVDKASPEFTKKPSYYSATVSYSIDDNCGLALSYFHSQINRRILRTYSLSAEKKVAEGMMAYADIAKFYQNAHTTKPKNKGTTFYTGIKLNF